MTIEEFNKTRFGNGMKVIYKGVENDIVSVDFEESLIGLGDVVKSIGFDVRIVHL